MRTRKWMGVVTGLSLCCLMLDVQPSQGQRGGPGGGPPDPERGWSMMTRMSGGTDTIDFSKLDPRMKGFIQQKAQAEGTPPIPDSGVWTKDQYMEHFNKTQAIRAANPQPSGSPGGGPPGGFSFGKGGPRGPSTPEDTARYFEKYDANKDGKLSREEVARSSSTSALFAQFDKNGDGFLDLAEYTALRQARDAGAGAPPQPPGAPAPTASIDPNSMYTPGGPPMPGRPDDRQGRKPEDARPSVYRYGKIPKEAPSWFTELDTDKDGQIGLYEWRKAGRPMSEFAEMDLNKDGYVTAEEWLRYQRFTLEKTRTDELVIAVSDAGAPVSGSSSSKDSSRSSGRGMWGGGPPRDSAAGDSTSASTSDKSDKSDGGDKRDKKSKSKRGGPPGGYRGPGR